MSRKFYPTRNVAVRIFHYLWASPASLLGMLVGGIGLLSGGQVDVHRGSLEFHGRFITWILDRFAGGVLAMTLGHTIIGKSAGVLAFVRDHEQVHVRQYERWGPLFIPAYLLCSMVLWIRRKDFYRENPFEAEAFRLSDPGNTSA